ncbi:hypothetical protein SAMN04488107_4270 [Geodermatophilus saharensis]|uniref:Membrane protein involved in the export of O-antigen and teichoic acid n=1 Tax=Geodermatophilus saharensis TaxID=1137994 RepID=A0A239IET5_9ACTN|nr:hypothetical protein [Geodermatophilus saharensis]SNS90944.1 hypothetical protein SAMN04488107_4270 [Geodermatophilus saharensis]
MLDTTPARPHTRHDRLPERRWTTPAGGVLVVAALLGATLLLPSLSDRGAVAGITTVVAVLLLGAVALVWPSTSRRGPLYTAGQLVLHLTPVLLLTTVFPLVDTEISSARIGGVGLTSVVLASSMTVPWLSQSVCMPLYRGIGDTLHREDGDALLASFCRAWPLIALRSLSVVALFAVPVQLVLDWPLQVLGAYLVLTVLHLLFVQLLVITNRPDHRGLWAAAWTAYAVALFLAPTVWALPPLAGILVLLVPLRRHVRQLADPLVLDRRDVAADLVRGLLLGAVLWADKFVFLLAAGRDFAVDVVFLALLPAILAYNAYFVLFAPRFDREVATMRSAMEDEPLERLHRHSSRLTLTILSGVVKTGVVGAALALVVTGGVVLWDRGSAPLAAAVAVASWAFMMTTVVSYKLDYVGQQRVAQVIGAAHLTAVVAAFALLPSGTTVYLALAGVELLLLALAVRDCTRHWGRPEYSLFWRHATSW